MIQKSTDVCGTCGFGGRITGYDRKHGKTIGTQIFCERRQRSVDLIDSCESFVSLKDSKKENRSD